MRKLKFQNGNYYHIYNRGVDKREVFTDEKDYKRFLRSMRELNCPGPIDSLYRQDQLRRQVRKETKSLRLTDVNRSDLVSFIAYCLNPNHYHFLLKQIQNNGISKFMHKLGLGYTRYFNEKYNRSGSLFQGPFKAVEIKSDAQLLYLSAYINGNAEIHKISKADKWPWSSYNEYCQKFNSLRKNLVSIKPNIIFNEFKSIKDYKNYVNIVIRESGQRKTILKNIY